MKTPSVLLVEDNAVTRRMIRQALESGGYSVLEAQDGATALGLMETHHPALVVQELELPDMDGFGLAAELRRRAREVTIVALTGFPSSGEAARISAAGIDDVITKPIEPMRLVPIIESHMPRTAPAAERFGVGRRLVIADDDPLNLKLTKLHLTRLGFEIVTAENGVQALERIRQVRPDAIISDVLMPRMDGFELAVALREDPAFGALPIILLTSSYVDPSDKELARRAGANELVFRTPELAELIDALRTSLNPPAGAKRVSSAVAGTLEVERIPRMVRGLERQVTLNAGLARRSAQRSAELTVLTAMSEAVLRSRDLHGALDQALAACFDAGGIAGGALYLLGDDGSLQVRAAGPMEVPSALVESFFGHELWLRRIIADAQIVQLGQPPLPDEIATIVLEAWEGDTGFIAPLVYADRPLGAVVMVARGDRFRGEDALAFARGVGNQLTQVVALAAAFADREAAERRANAHASVLDALLRHAPDIVMRVDAAGTILFLNRGVGTRSAHELRGTSWLGWVGPEHRQHASDVLRNVVATGRVAECEVASDDDPPRWYSLRLSPTGAEQGAPGAVVVARDNTEVRNAQARLLVADRMASIGTLVDGVVHEINDPLAAVLANLDLALEDLRRIEPRAVPPGVGEALSDARDGAERVRLILRDLGVFARAGVAGEPVDVHRVLESTLRLAWSRIRHRARLTRHFRNVPAVNADEALLAQVFLNLIVNAAESIPEGDADANEIRVETSTDAAGRVVVTVADTGAGIPEHLRERVFAPFFTTKAAGSGTGLGLAISRRLVEEAGGDIGFESQPSRGTTFNVALPSTPRVPQRSAPVQARPAAALRRGRVLVVEDDPMLGQTVRRILEGEHDVTVVRGARAALDRIEAGEWDVILSDLMMPQMTGMQLHDEVARTRPDLVPRMVFMTGGAFTEQARAFLARVANPRIEKPVEIAALRSTVNSIVR